MYQLKIFFLLLVTLFVKTNPTEHLVRLPRILEVEVFCQKRKDNE